MRRAGPSHNYDLSPNRTNVISRALMKVTSKFFLPGMSNQDNVLRLESDEMVDKCLAMSLGLIHLGSTHI